MAVSRTRTPQILVLRIPVVGRAMLEKGNLFTSMLHRTCLSCNSADSLSIPNTSRASSVGIVASNLQPTEHVFFKHGCFKEELCRYFDAKLIWCRPVHPPYSSVFVTEFNPEYGNTDLLFWLRKRSSLKYGNGHGHRNIFFTVISSVKNVAPSVGNVHASIYYARCQATRNTP